MTYVVPANRLRRTTGRTAPTTVVQHTEVAVTEKVSLTRTSPSESRSHLLREPEEWGWEELRDYVVAQIEDIFGAFPRDQRKEAGIFKRFHATYGSAAPLIAQYAFEVCDGWWKGAPIQITRFCKNSDPYFADPILKALSED